MSTNYGLAALLLSPSASSIASFMQDFVDSELKLEIKACSAGGAPKIARMAGSGRSFQLASVSCTTEQSFR